MSNRPLLTFAFSTMSDRIKNLKRPDFSEPHEVLVLVQNPKELSYVLELPKVKLIELKSQGVAKSRNAALQHATGEFLIFGDDDITFLNTGVKAAVKYMQENPGCSIVLAQAIDEDGNLNASQGRCD